MDQQIADFISGAVAAGATAIWKGFFTESGKNAYNKLKSLLSGDSDIQDNITRLEKQPNRTSYQLSIKEDIERLSLYENPDIQDAAAAVIAAAQAYADQISAAAAIDINQLNAEFIEIRRLRTTGQAAIRLHNADIKRGVTITDIDAGSASEDSKKSRRLPSSSSHFDYGILDRRHKRHHTPDYQTA